MITVAFYKGRDHRLDRFIQWYTDGPYSHVEIMAGRVKAGGAAFSFSASGRDGGVRMKWINFKPEHWDMIHLDLDPWPVITRAVDECDKRYDYLSAALLDHGNRFTRWLGRNRWYCNELVADLLDIPAPYGSPSTLHALLKVAVCRGTPTT